MRGKVGARGCKPFAYLVQGRASLVEQFAFLMGDTSDFYFLTYDEPLIIPGATGFFDSEVSWAGGRNMLLQVSQKLDYEYFIFLDDDVVIVDGTFRSFELLLLEYRPYLGLPLGDEIQRSGRWNPRQYVQQPMALDQLMQAYSRDAVLDGVLVPYTTKFDHLSWWYSCEINQHQVLSQFRNRTAQFNSVRVLNSVHDWVKGNPAPGSRYRGGVRQEDLVEVRVFLGLDFSVRPRHPWDYIGNDSTWRQVGIWQVWFALREVLQLSKASSMKRRMRKFRTALIGLISILLYLTVWKRSRVELAARYRVGGL